MAWDDDFEEVRGPRQGPRFLGSKKQVATPEDFPYESVQRAAWAKERAGEVAASEAMGNFEGNMGVQDTNWASMFEVVKASAPASDDWATQFEPVEAETPLMSLKGGGSLLRQIGPRIARGILAMQFQSAETELAELPKRREQARIMGELEPGPEVEQALSARVREKQAALQEADAAIEKIQGKPSYPLHIAQEAVGSIAQNAPGMAISALTRRAGPVAMTPALVGAHETAEAEAYAGARLPGPDGRPKTQDIEEARRLAEGAGAAEVAFELVPMGYLFKNLGKEGVLSLIKGYLVRDLGTELGTTATNKVAEWTTLEPEKPVGEFLAELKDELITTGLVTMVSAPIQSGGLHLMARAGRLGKQRPDEPTELPGQENRRTEQGNAVTFGAELSDQTAPTADLATNELDSQTVIALETQAYATKPEDITDEQLAEGHRVLAEIKAKEARPPLPQAELVWSQFQNAPSSAVEDAGEFGASPRQAANAINYINPNQGDRLDRPITFGPDEVIDLTPRQIMPEATTYVIGRPSDDRPADWLKAAHETTEWLRQKYLPDATIVLSNEQLYNNSALGWHHTTGLKKHLIVPAVLRKPSRGWAEYNPNTIATATYNLIHEFGHALISDRFYQVDSDDTVGAIRDAGRNGLIPEELLSKLPVEQQAVVREFNAVKARVLDESMTAQEFLDTWVGPAKAGRKTFLKTLGVSAKAPAKQLVNALTLQAKANSRVSSSDAAAALQQRAIEDYLSLDEYLAEQLTRFAYQKQWDQTSPIVKLFGNILSGLRGVFTDSKRHGLIAPGTAFNEWMEGLSKAPRVLEEKEALVKRRKTQKAKSKIPPQPKAPRAKRSRKAGPIVETVQHNVESDTHKTREQKARGAVMNLIRTGDMKREDLDYADLMGYINRGEFEEFNELYTKIAKKTVSFELDDKPKPKNFLDDSKYLYHAVRNDVDLDAIFAEGLRPGTNLSDMQGQAFTDEGGTFVVVEKKAARKGYQNDYVSQGTLRPVAILKDTLMHETRGYTEEQSRQALNEIELEFEAIERKTWLSDKDREQQQEKLIRRSDKILDRTGQPNIDTEAVLANYTRHGVPVIPIEVRYDERTNKTKVFRKRGTNVSFELDVTAEDDWVAGKFSSPGFKAFFGDWERDPIGASKIRVGAFQQKQGVLSINNEGVTPPLVLFTTLERLNQGVNAFHASTPRGQQYAESQSVDSPDDLTLVPVVLNIRNPFIQGDQTTPAPSRQDLEAQGFDGIVYQNDLDGDLSFVVFRPQQIKVVSDRTPYAGQHNFHLELDIDQSTKEGWGTAKFLNNLKNFLRDPERMKRALKHTLQGMRFAMQMQQIAQKNPDVTDATFIMQANTDYTSYNASRLHIPNKVLDYWSNMRNKSFDAVSRFLRAQAESGVRWFNIKDDQKLVEGRVIPWTTLEVTETTRQKAREHGINVDTPHGMEVLTHIWNIENSLLDSLNETERVLINLLALRHGHNALAFESTKNTLRRQIHELRQAPFLPRKWFGRYMVIVSEKSGTGYEVKHKEAYDSQDQRDQAFAKLEKRLKPGQLVQKKELTDTQFVLMGLPKDFLDVVGSELGLEPAQVSKLSEILQPVKQEKLLREHDLKLMGITGHSADIMRSYASYTFHQANLQGKVMYRKKFNMAIGKLRREVDDLSYSNSPDYYRKAGILAAMEGMRDYIMNPPNEWHATRAVISLGYLMGNLKTAIANSFGLALTWTDLTARHGSHKGELMFMQAVYRNSVAVWAGGTLPPYIQEGLARAQKEGVLDQTFAYHVAGMANANRIWRVLSRSRAIRYFQKDVELAMMPFRMMELFTRRVTFLAALEENHQRKIGADPATAKKMGANEAYKAAVQRVNHIQNDYTAGNRVPFMRGKGSSVTIFGSFAQHAGFHGLGQYESGQRRLIEHEIDMKMRPESDRPTKTQLLHGHTMRMWALLLMLAGYQGLPFAENLLDFAEWIWRRWGKRTVRQELREFVTALDDEPHLWSRGFSHNVMGLDLSRSVGMGELLPGTGMLVKNQKDNFDEKVGTMAVDLAGVTGHTIKWLYDMTLSDKPLEKALRSAPGLGGNMWNSHEWSKHGVRGPAGGLILKDPKTGLLRDLTAFEIYAKAAGFNPTIVSQNREINYENYDREVYWSIRRDRLKANIWRGVEQEDPELEHDAREAVHEFNEWIGNDPALKSLRITNGEISKFLQAKRDRQRKEERGQSQQKRFRGLHQDIRQSHESTEEGSP